MRRHPPSYLLSHGGYAVEVTYKDIKNLRLRVLAPDGRLAVSVPRHVDARSITAFIDANSAWIARSQQRIRMVSPGKEPLVDGGRARLWGQWRELRVVAGPRASARLDGHAISLAGPDDDALERALDDLYRRELRKRLDYLLVYWQARIGKETSQIKLRRMTSRWGSCNPHSRAVTLNLALAEQDPNALEYVLVHELAHLWERGHGPRFTALMDEHLPDWRRRRAALRGQP